MGKIEKLDYKDIMRRFNVPDELEDEIKKRIRRIERKGTIPKAILNRRGLAMQKMYIRLKEMSEAQIAELREIVIDINESRRIVGSYQRESEQKRLIDKLFDLTGYKGLSEPELTALKDFEVK